MNAIDVFKQSLNFYYSLLNKILLISVASSAPPFIHAFFSSSEMPSTISMLVMMLINTFFSLILVSFIHQYSTYQNDNLLSGLSFALKKFFPVLLSYILISFILIMVAIPASMVAGVLSSGVDDYTLQGLIRITVILIPVCIVMYKLYFSTYLIVVDNLNPIEALKASNVQVKGNKLVLRGIVLLVGVFLLYALLMAVVNLMIGVDSELLNIVMYALNVLILPIFTVFSYRLFLVTKKPENRDEEQ